MKSLSSLLMDQQSLLSAPVDLLSAAPAQLGFEKRSSINEVADEITDEATDDLSLNLTQEELNDQLQSLAMATGKYFVTYFPVLAKLCDNPKAALMLGHAIYLTRSMLNDESSRQGWFWKSQEDWFKSTGLSLREQASARDCLLELGFIEERRAGMPARLYFRINLDTLGRGLAKEINSQWTGWTWEERAVRTLLGRPIAFYAPFAWLLDSATSGIYLSQLVSEVRLGARANLVLSQGYFTGRRSDAWNEFGLGEKAARRAKQDLETLGILTCRRESAIKGKLLVRLDLFKLVNAVLDCTLRINNAGNSQSTMLETHNQQCEKPALWFGQKRITGSAKSAELVRPKTHNSFGQKRISRYAEMAEPLIKGFKHTKLLLLDDSKIEQEQVQSTTDVVVASENLGFGKEPKAQAQALNQSLSQLRETIALHFPSFFVPKEVEAASQLLKQMDCASAQELLDEIAGKADAKTGAVRSGLGLLHTLITAKRNNCFAPAYAAQVNYKREQAIKTLQKREADALAADLAKQNAPAPEVARATALENLKQLKQLVGKRRTA
jgi:hypothetical protein